VQDIVGANRRSAEVRKVLRAEVPWFRELCSVGGGENRISRFLAEATENRGVSLQVVELVGEPGDVYVMHPWMPHNVSPNCGVRPRMAMTERIQHTNRWPGLELCSNRRDSLKE
jgi:hypothetical protein